MSMQAAFAAVFAAARQTAVQHGSCCCTFHLHDKPLLRGPTPLCQLQLNFFVRNPFDFETKFMTIVVIYNARPELYCRYWMRCVC